MKQDKEKGDLTQLAPALLKWYDLGARILPWREEPTPYRVWVSEIMLQQTQVATVIPYFQRFITALPTIEALARVEEGVLSKLWEGLGYYNRVRNMQKAANVVVANFGGELPGDYQQLLTLPGIGEYTAGAIASIAYGEKVVAVDGNVMRVFARLLVSERDIALAKNKKWFQEMVQLALPESRVGDFNQSLMELGARVCLPKAQPDCGNCPIGSYCGAYEKGQVGQYPVKSGKKPRKIEQKTILLIVAQGKVWIYQRPMVGLLSGLWSFYSLSGHLNCDEIGGLLQEQGLKVSRLEAIGHAKHLFTHLEWQMQGWLVEIEGIISYENGVWADLQAIHAQYALPSAFQVYTKQLPKWLS